DERKAQAESAARARRRLRSLDEGLEDALEDVRLDAGARVAHADLRLRVALLERYADAAAVRGAAHGVLDGVADHLGKARAIAAHADGRRGELERELHARAFGERPMVVDRLAKRVVERDLLHVQRDLAARKARHVEEIVDEAAEVPGLAGDDRAGAS